MTSNKGNAYEEKIFNICNSKSLIFPQTQRAGGGNSADIKLQNKNGELINIEVKSHGADYGQKKLNYECGNWKWAIIDHVSEIYDQMMVIDGIPQTYIPINANHQNLSRDEWAKKKKIIITDKEKEFDQKNFEKNNISCNIEILFEYYALRDCYYMQLDKHGFYHLKYDKFNIGTSQFDGGVKLRRRAKLINRTNKKGQPTPWNYSFFAVMKLGSDPSFSEFNLDPKSNQKFPNIYNSRSS
jgi:hypothetical protein